MILIEYTKKENISVGCILTVCKLYVFSRCGPQDVTSGRGQGWGQGGVPYLMSGGGRAGGPMCDVWGGGTVQ